MIFMRAPGFKKREPGLKRTAELRDQIEQIEKALKG